MGYFILAVDYLIHIVEYIFNTVILNYEKVQFINILFMEILSLLTIKNTDQLRSHKETIFCFVLIVVLSLRYQTHYKFT